MATKKIRKAIVVTDAHKQVEKLPLTEIVNVSTCTDNWH